MTRALLWSLLLVSAVAAQDAPRDTTRPPETEPIDVQVLRSVYDVEVAPVEWTMRGVNASAYPIYFAASPLMWGGTLAAGADTRPAIEMTLAQVANFGTTFALKNIVQRPRPYAALDDIAARDRQHQGDEVFDPHSFPSGHTSSAFVIATSLSLSYPKWYVVAPSMTWAGLMGVARVWHGVHYPSDVLIGAGIGTATAFAVHYGVALLREIDTSGGDEAAVVPVYLVIPL